MNIKVIDLIKEHLIGGRNGEMAYIYNNPFMFELFNQWKNNKENFHKHKNDGDIAFKEFLKACLEEEVVENKAKTPQVIGYKTLTKKYDVSSSDENYKEWKKLEEEIKEKRHKQEQLVKAIAKNKNEALTEISNLKIQDTYLGKTIVFEFSIEAVLEDETQE